MPSPKILVVPGSLRSASHNAKLAALAAKELTRAGADVTHISLRDYPLPIVDHAKGTSTRARRLRHVARRLTASYAAHVASRRHRLRLSSYTCML